MIVLGTLSEVLSKAPFDLTYLLVRLSDGQYVVCDGDSACWLELAEFCSDCSLTVKSIEIRFRSSSLSPCPDDAEGYFFRAGAAASLSGDSRAFSLFFLGHLSNGKVHVKAVVVPEMTVVNGDIRDPDDKESVGDYLITVKPRSYSQSSEVLGDDDGQERDGE
jgi:hypothetical protein